MLNPFVRLVPMAFAALLAACGGGGGDGPAEAPASPARDMAVAYVGTWALACRVTTPAGPTDPDGESEDEVMTVTRLDNTRLATSSVKSLYRNTLCSTLTSHTRGFPVTHQADLVGTRALATSEVDLLQFRPDDGSPPFKALARVEGAQLFITRADAVGTPLDAQGFPQTLDLSRGYTRVP